MASVWIQHGDTEPIEVLALDSAKQPITGLTNLSLSVRRVGNATPYFDWSDNTFKTSPVTKYIALEEIDATKAPGEYRLNSGSHLKGFNTSAITNPVNYDTYRIVVAQYAAPYTAANFPQIGEIRSRKWTEYIDRSVSESATYDDVKTALRDFGLDHLVSVNPGIVPPASNTYIRQVLDKLDALEAAETVEVRQSYAYSALTKELVGQVWAETETDIVTDTISVTVTWYDEDGTSMFSIFSNVPDTQHVFKLTYSNPGFLSGKSYYAKATLDITDVGLISSAKGAFTIG